MYVYIYIYIYTHTYKYVDIIMLNLYFKEQMFCNVTHLLKLSIYIFYSIVLFFFCCYCCFGYWTFFSFSYVKSQ